MGFRTENVDNLNFRVQRQVRAGTYYVRVEGHGNAIGNYTVHATFSSDGDDHGNTRALATRLSLGSSIAGRIEPGDDVDYFQFTVVVPGELILYTTGNIDTVGWLEAGGRNLADDDDSGDGLNFRIQHRTGTGTHHIKVESHGGQTGNYTLHTRFTSDGGGGADDHGNTRADATIIQNVGDSVAGRIEPGDDVDYFRVRVHDPGQLTVYTTGNIDTIGWLEDSSGDTLLENDDNGDNLNFRIQHKVSAGWYHIKVKSLDGQTGNYTLHTRFTSDGGGGADDHGNTRADATIIQNVGDSVAGRIEPGDDVDYFRVRVNALGQLTVYTTGNIDTSGQLQNNSGALLTKDDDNGDNLNFRMQHKVNAGTYYVEVTSWAEVGNYTLHTGFTPDRGGGTDDHGNTRADTTLIQNVGDSVAGRIEPGDDIDYFRVRVHDPGQLTVYTTGNIDTIGWLEDISGDTLSDDDDDGDNLNFRIQHKVSAGWYRIKVKSHGDQTGNYTLRTSFTPDDLRLTIPEDLISEVAFGPNSTYFVLNAQYPILTGASGDLSYGGCILTLDLPGVPDNTLLATVWLTVLERFIQAIDEIDRAVPLFQFLDQLGVSPFDLVADVGAGVFLPNARKYFMFPLETMQEVRDKIQEEAIRSQNITLIAAAIGSLPLAGDVGAVIVSLGVIELQRLSALIELVQSTMDPKIHLNPGVGELVNAIIGGRSILDVFIDFFDRDNRPNDRLRYLIYIPKRVEEIDIKVEQKYNLKGQTGELTYEGTWNLVSGTLAAPNAHSMSLADYPPFQELPLEVQEFLLRYFGEPMGIGDWQIPEVTSLLPNYPNPFNPETWIPYQLSEAADVTMTLYDITGRVVRHLDLGHQRAGVYHNRSRAAYWDGRNAQGEPVASGVYFYTLKAGEFAATRKMLIRK